MAKFGSGVTEGHAPDVAQGGALGASEAAASLTPSGGSVASNGQAAAAASAVGGMRHRRAGSTVRVQDKVLLDAAIEVEKTRRLAAGDPAAATIVGRNIDCDALLKQGLAETPGLERALALAKQYDAQLKGVSADQELGLATARAYESYDTAESDGDPYSSHDIPIDGAGLDSSPENTGLEGASFESTSLQSTPPEGMSLEVASTDAGALSAVAGADHEGPVAKRRLGAVAGVALAASVAAALLFTGKCAVDSPDATLAATKGVGTSSTAGESSARSAATAPAAMTHTGSQADGVPAATSTAAADSTASLEQKTGAGATAPVTSRLPEVTQSPSTRPAVTSRPRPTSVRQPQPYRPHTRRPGGKSSPFIIHPGSQ